MLLQGKTFAVTEFFLEDVLEKTRYKIKSEFENFEGNSRRRRRQQESKKDLLSELFEAFFIPYAVFMFNYFCCFFS